MVPQICVSCRGGAFRAQLTSNCMIAPFSKWMTPAALSSVSKAVTSLSSAVQRETPLVLKSPILYAVAALTRTGLGRPIRNQVRSMQCTPMSITGPPPDLVVEMESAALYLHAARAGKKALSFLTISDILGTEQEISPEARQKAFDTMIRAALLTAEA